MACSMYAFFWSHNQFKTLLLVLSGEKQLGAVLDLLAGYGAGVGTAVLTEPIWCINTRLMLMKRRNAKQSAEKIFKLDGNVMIDQDGKPVTNASGPIKFEGTPEEVKNKFQWVVDASEGKYEGVVDCARKIYFMGGVYGFFKGLPGALGTVLNSAIQLMVYEQLRKLVLKTAEAVGPGTAFLLGAVSKMIATLVTYPLQTVGTRMQNQKSEKKDDDNKVVYSGTLDCARKMLATEGVGSFFGGLRPRLLQMVLQNAFKFMFYERIVEVILVLLLGKAAKKN